MDKDQSTSNARMIASHGKPAHSLLSIPGMVGVLNVGAVYFQRASASPRAELDHAIGLTIPWYGLIWASVLGSLAISTFVLIAIRFEMPRPHSRRVRNAWLWNVAGVALQAPPVFGLAVFYMFMMAGGLNHFRD